MAGQVGHPGVRHEVAPPEPEVREVQEASGVGQPVVDDALTTSLSVRTMGP